MKGRLPVPVRHRTNCLTFHQAQLNLYTIRLDNFIFGGGLVLVTSAVPNEIGIEKGTVRSLDDAPPLDKLPRSAGIVRDNVSAIASPQSASSIVLTTVE